jgi:hypothetical protein
MGEASWGKASVKLRERAAIEEYNASADQAKAATAFATVKGLTEATSRGQGVAPPTITPEEQKKVVEAIASFFGTHAPTHPEGGSAVLHRIWDREPPEGVCWIP